MVTTVLQAVGRLPLIFERPGWIAVSFPFEKKT